MQHRVEVDEVKRLVVIRVSGEVTVELIVPVALQERILARDLGYGVIFDYREAVPKISYAEVFYWLDKHYNAIDRSLKSIQTAYIAAQENLEFFQFVELTWGNRGAHLRVFLDEAEAVAWFSEHTPGRERVRLLRERLVAR